MCSEGCIPERVCPHSISCRAQFEHTSLAAQDRRCSLSPSGRWRESVDTPNVPRGSKAWWDGPGPDARLLAESDGNGMMLYYTESGPVHCSFYCSEPQAVQPPVSSPLTAAVPMMPCAVQWQLARVRYDAGGYRGPGWMIMAPSPAKDAHSTRLMCIQYDSGRIEHYAAGVLPPEGDGTRSLSLHILLLSFAWPRLTRLVLESRVQRAILGGVSAG